MENIAMLVIGKGLWSLSPWMLMHAHRVKFEDLQVSLHPHNRRQRLDTYSDSGKLPVLYHDDLIIWDSLAICEFVSECYLLGKGWPLVARDRAVARSITVELHSGFKWIHKELPLDCKAKATKTFSTETIQEIKRVEDIWRKYSREDKESNVYLFGQFSIADCFYAQMVLRFKKYDVKVKGQAFLYQNSILAHPSISAWLDKLELDDGRRFRNAVKVAIFLHCYFMVPKRSTYLFDTREQIDSYLG